MKKRILAGLAILLLASGAIAQGDGKSVALAWLQLVDAGSYAASWDQAAPFFQQQVSKSQWESAVGSVRAPLGELISREVVSATAYTSLPGAPDGEYIVLSINASYEGQESAIETVTMSIVDGVWRVVGYFIR
ncbi:MAG: DUF4019 domain-containing protein [Pseudomonadota bacterium]